MSRRRTPPPSPSETPAGNADSATLRMLLAQAQALSTRLAALNEVAVAMQRSNDVEVLLNVMATQARWVLDFQLCTVTTFHDQQFHLRVLRCTVPNLDHSHSGLWHTQILQQVIRQQHAVVRNDLQIGETALSGMHSVMALPLFEREQVIGSLNFYSATGRNYTQDDLRIATALAMQVSVILFNAHLLNQVTRTRDELSTVLESIGDGVLVIDLRGRVLLSNRALQAILQSERSPQANRQHALKLFRQPRLRQSLLPRDQRRTIVEQMIALRRGVITPPSGRIHLADGRYLAWSCAVLTGMPEGLVVTLRDITAEQELEQMRDDMVRMLVHDFRTPLTSISMGLDLLRIYDQMGNTDEKAKIFDMIRTSTTSLIAQVTTLLDVSKLEAGHMQLDREVTLLGDLATQSVMSLLNLARFSEIDLRLGQFDELSDLAVDRALIRRVIDNLIGNALKFTPERGVVEVRSRLISADLLEVEVCDTGPGVPPNAREHIFEKYGQVRNKDAKRGTGLGLAFCRLVVEAHGGRIGVRDAPSGGSIFWFRLPRHHSMVS